MRRFGLRVALRTVVDVLADIAHFGFLALRSRTQLAAENLFLRTQLGPDALCTGTRRNIRRRNGPRSSSA